MTLSDILARGYDECGYQSSPAATITTRFTQYVNDGIRMVLSEPGLGRLLDSDDPFTFASVASQARYVMPEAVAEIRGMSERTNNLTLDSMSLDRYRRIDPNPTTDSGTPQRWVPIGKVAVAVQPTAADAIFIKSSSASDGGSVTAFLEGVRTGGYRATDSVALNGTTAVQFPAFTDWIEITDCYISANAVGTLTLRQTSGSGTTLATISVGHKRPHYYGFYLWPTPASAVTYYVDYRREVEDLANSADMPPLPTDFHPMVVDYVCLREFSLKADPRAQLAQARVDKWLRRLKYATQWASDELPVMGLRRVGLSRLGANFPADTWRVG